MLQATGTNLNGWLVLNCSTNLIFMMNVCFEFVSDASSVNVNRMKERITELEVSCETRQCLCSTAIRLKHNLTTSGSL